MLMSNLSDKDIKQILKSYGEDSGPINDTTRKVYINKIKKLQKEKRPINQRKSTPYQTSTFKQSDLDKDPKVYNSFKTSTTTYNERKSIGNPSPISYASLNSCNHNFRNTNVSSDNLPSPAYNNSNNSKRWYNGSLSSLSNYLSRSNDTNCVDISDADASDNENQLINRLRKNYSKTGHNDYQSSNSKTSTSRIAKCSNYLKTEHLPNILLACFLIFIFCLIASYFVISSKHSNMELDLALERFLCQNNNHEDCILKEELPKLKFCLARLFDLLSEHAGQSICQLSDDTYLSFRDAKERLNYYLKAKNKEPVDTDEWNKLLMLILKLEPNQLGIVTLDNERKELDYTKLPEKVTYLKSLRPKCSLFCRTKLLVLYSVNYLLYICQYIIIGVIFGVVIYLLNRLRLRRLDAHEKRISEFRDIISTISNILQEQLRNSEQSSGVDSFLPLLRIKTMIQHNYLKVRDPKYWEEFKKYMYKYESSIELKERIVEGEVLQWRGRPTWQGSALQTDSEVTFERAPTECIKIRNMEIKGLCPNINDFLKDQLLKRLSNVGPIRHIGFTSKDNKIVAYVLCENRIVSAKAFKLINANYFNGNLLNVKFIRKDKYLERFPESTNYS